MIDFTECRNKAEQARRAEREYERQIREKDYDDVTIEEMLYIEEKNENFVGDYADPVKLEQYEELKVLAAEFLSACSDARRIMYDEPERHQMNACVFIEVDCAMLLKGEKISSLVALLNKADFVAAAVIENGIRLSFMVLQVWKQLD